MTGKKNNFLEAIWAHAKLRKDGEYLPLFSSKTTQSLYIFLVRSYVGHKEGLWSIRVNRASWLCQKKRIMMSWKSKLGQEMQMKVQWQGHIIHAAYISFLLFLQGIILSEKLIIHV